MSCSSAPSVVRGNVVAVPNAVIPGNAIVSVEIAVVRGNAVVLRDNAVFPGNAIVCGNSIMVVSTVIQVKKVEKSGMILPKAASEVDFDISDPPLEPSTQASK